MTDNFWEGKKVLVTGSSGFIGSKLAAYLMGKGAFVVGISLHSLPEEIKIIRGLKYIAEQFVFEEHDLADFSSLDKIFQKYEIDTVFHLAASAIVSQAAKSPLTTIHSNVLGTLNVLEAARHCNVRRVLIASSDKTYGDHARDNTEPLPYRESYALKGLDIYSSSKVCADMLAQAYAFQYKIPIALARCCNVYGPGDLNFTRLIPRTAMLLLKGEPPTIRSGHERVLREYMYIDDVLRAYDILAQKIEAHYGESGELLPLKGSEPFGWAAFNVGSYTKEQTAELTECENIRSVTQVINALRTQIDPIDPVISEQPPQYIEIPDEYSDSSKLLSLGFAPQVYFEEGLRSSVAWYKENYDFLNKTVVL